MDAADEVVLIVVGLDVTERKPPNREDIVALDGLELAEVGIQRHVDKIIDTMEADDSGKLFKRIENILYGYGTIACNAATDVANGLFLVHNTIG